jgi:hypothetical protein
LKRSRGYIRLTLNAIDVSGRQFPVQTASLFVHADASPGSTSDGNAAAAGIRLESGRILIFRLVEPVSIEPAAVEPASLGGAAAPRR